MNRYRCCFVAVVVATSLIGNALGDKTKGFLFPHRLVVELADGSRVIGTTTVEAFPVRHDIGAIQVELRSIVSITTPCDGGKSVMILSNGDRLQVDLEMRSVSLKTIVGNFDIPVSSIRGMLVENYTLSGEPGAWPILRTYDYTANAVTERSYTDKAFTLASTMPKDGNTNNILREVVYGLYGTLREVRYPTGLRYGLDGGTWTRTEMGSYLPAKSRPFTTAKNRKRPVSLKGDVSGLRVWIELDLAMRAAREG